MRVAHIVQRSDGALLAFGNGEAASLSHAAIIVATARHIFKANAGD